jgi:signal transduction histidine kinase/DNA-binding response OmpR family regulator
MGENDSALLYYEKGIEITEQEGLMEESARIYQNMGMLFRKIGEYNQALIYYQKSLKLSQETGCKVDIQKAYNGLGIIYQEQKNMPRAIENYQECLKINEELDNKRGIASTYHNIGLIYRQLNDLDKSIEYLEKSKNYFEGLDDKRWLIRTYNSLGLVYKDLNELEKAKQYLTDGLILAKQLNLKEDIVSSQVNLGNIYKLQGEFVPAMDYYNKALNILGQHQNLTLLASIYFNIGSLHNNFGDYSTGKQWCTKAYDLAKKYNFLEEEMLSCECLNASYKNLGNLTLAYDYLKKFYAARDTLRKFKNEEEVNRLEMLYAFDKQHLADSLAMEEQKLIQEFTYQKQLNQERMARNTSIYFVIGLLIFAILLFSRLYITRKTNRKLAEKNKIIEYEKQRAEESERAKEQFFNNVSHEFRTPLTLILGPLDKIMQKVTNPEFKLELGMVQRNALRLHNMINELLNLYKLESGTVKLNAKKDDIGQFVYRYVQSFEPLAKQKNINLSFKADSELLEIYFDSEKMEKVLSNLLSNAFKFVDSGGNVVVSVLTYSNQIDTSKGVLISVSDDGIGIPPEKINNVFDRFYQVDESLSRNYEGTGIGLSLTKELVELHHGWIKAESKEGKGATFTFFLPSGKDHLKTEDIAEDLAEDVLEDNPAVKVEKDADPEIASDQENAKTKKGLPLLLIVEDNPDMRSYIKNDLNSVYKIIEAGNGEEGLEKAIKYVPDLVVSDIMMPKMDGNAMSFQLKQDERTSHIPVILLTARTSTEQKIEGLETGADAYISKPFNPRELKVRIKNLIDQRQKLRTHYGKDVDLAIRIAESNITSMDQQFLEKALKVVEENMSDADFTVEIFGEKMAMSRVQLHRKLTALTDQSASRFIRSIRMKHAAEFLAKDGATVTETAYKFGFNNLSYFAKCFNEDFKMTPSDWVARHNNGNDKKS